MSVQYTTVYKRVIVLTFGAAAAGLLLYLIWRNALDESYDMSTLTLIVLGSIILGTIGVDIYALQEHPAAGALSGRAGTVHDEGRGGDRP